MKYVIWRVINQKIMSNSYSSMAIERCVLERLNELYMEDTHATMEDAVHAIQINGDKLKCMELVILPTVNVNYEGKIS